MIKRLPSGALVMDLRPMLEEVTRNQDSDATFMRKQLPDGTWITDLNPMLEELSRSHGYDPNKKTNCSGCEKVMLVADRGPGGLCFNCLKETKWGDENEVDEVTTYYPNNTDLW